MNITTPITLAEAKNIGRSFAFSIRHKDGEYRVNLLGAPESTAYYTTDRIDAVETGVAMREFARTNSPCQGGCSKVRGVILSDSPVEWLCFDCSQATR